ncbi:aldo-keto reductase family 1 member D1-like isoform X3 [Carcharodon carcharias]|uniref:aldo-keto reductase family 1 member D1-like isoform X3 n=1 Tax=Carcharodon carcharias TaxID=13397 RepID=UPI001B7E6DC2|nr:aldo-keto reductase family 1 member D1-like isoform X3 [Carcharodon carcharias]
MSLTAQDHRILLNDGNNIPIIGLGTYSAPRITAKDACYHAVKVAIDVGYRHFDGALVYGNEDEVGRAVREKIDDGTVRRDDIFYCGKLWNTYHPPEMVRGTLEKSLKLLKFDYMDLYIIELPLAFKPGDVIYPRDESGNFLYAPTDLCATWEVECHPYFPQPKLKEFCDSHGIVIVGYSPLGTCRDSLWVNTKIPSLLDDPVLNSVAARHQKTSAQVALRFLAQRNVVAIPKSFNPERIKQNFEIFDFSLTSEEMKQINALNRNERYVELLMWKDHPEYPFNEEY